MKINTNSWHYKGIKIFSDPWMDRNHMPKDLCSYIRKLALLLIFALAGLMAVPGLILDINFIINDSELFNADYLQTTYGWLYYFVALSMCLGFLLGGIISIIIVAGFAFIVNKFIEDLKKVKMVKFWSKINTKALQNTEILHVPVPKEPNIFILWWRAKKEKICPLIEYEDQ